MNVLNLSDLFLEVGGVIMLLGSMVEWRKQGKSRKFDSIYNIGVYEENIYEHPFPFLESVIIFPLDL